MQPNDSMQLAVRNYQGIQKMKWKNLFSPVKNIDPEGARDFISSYKEGSYTLLDVRQPKEYEKHRIPGAKLIPLPNLMDRLDELDPAKPVIVY